MACFFNVQENKRFKIVNLFGFCVCEGGKQLLYHKYQAFLQFYVENIVIMLRIRILGNYADPHRRNLSGAMTIVLYFLVRLHLFLVKFGFYWKTAILTLTLTLTLL